MELMLPKTYQEQLLQGSLTWGMIHHHCPQVLRGVFGRERKVVIFFLYALLCIHLQYILTVSLSPGHLVLREPLQHFKLLLNLATPIIFISA